MSCRVVSLRSFEAREPRRRSTKRDGPPLPARREMRRDRIAKRVERVRIRREAGRRFEHPRITVWRRARSVARSDPGFDGLDGKDASTPRPEPGDEQLRDRTLPDAGPGPEDYDAHTVRTAS